MFREKPPDPEAQIPPNRPEIFRQVAYFSPVKECAEMPTFAHNGTDVR